MKLLFSQSGNAFWAGKGINFWGIHRWGDLAEKAGMYRVIVPVDVAQILGWPNHPNCVVDDFGTLVRVEA